MEDSLQKNILDAYNYFQLLAQDNPNFANEIFFKMNDAKKKECFNIINRIESINKLIPKEKKRSKKTELSKEKGALLEDLSKTVLNDKNIFSDYKNIRCSSNEIDVLLSPASMAKLMKELIPSLMQDDLIVECKNHNKKIDVTWVGKVYSLMKYKNVNNGIIFSFHELKGINEWDSAKGLVKKIFLNDKTIIINITINDIIDMLNSEKDTIIDLIERKVKSLKFHTDFTEFITKHPAEN